MSTIERFEDLEIWKIANSIGKTKKLIGYLKKFEVEKKEKKVLKD